MTGHDWLVCPHCRQPLTVNGRVAGCPAGHRFDVARQGYLNLLGRAPGRNADTPEMLDHRQRFLAEGHYQPIVSALVEACLPAQPLRIVEVGAGTGHYLSALLDALPRAEGLAVDVSPAAARRLARCHPRVQAIVADAWQPLPVADGISDLVVSVFAPRNASEFARILAGDGRLVTVTPGAAHLAEAREHLALLDIQPDKDDRLERSLDGHFIRLSSTPVSFVLDLSRDSVAALVGMGPNAFHAHRPAQALSVGVEVSITTWRRPGTKTSEQPIS